MKKQYLNVCLVFWITYFRHLSEIPGFVLQFHFNEEMQFQPRIENLMVLLISKLVLVEQEVLFFQLCPKTGLEKNIC